MTTYQKLVLKALALIISYVSGGTSTMDQEAYKTARSVELELINAIAKDGRELYNNDFERVKSTETIKKGAMWRHNCLPDTLYFASGYEGMCPAKLPGYMTFFNPIDA